MTTLLSLITSSLLASGGTAAAGPEAEASGSASVSLDGAGGAKSKKAKKAKKAEGGGGEEERAVDAAASDEAAKAEAAKKPWIRRWAPTRNMVEVGLMGGVYMPGRNHELFEPTTTLVDQGFRRYRTLGPEVGVRVSYLPLRVLGIELEGAAMPTQTANQVDATIFSLRGGLLAQLPYWSVTPFIVAGGGMLGVRSLRSAVGNDIDPMAYFGGGLKLYISRQVSLRFDFRDVMSHKRGVDETFKNHNFEGLVSFVLTFNRPKPKVLVPPPDTDGDTILDPDDQCINEPGVPEYKGCPIPDTDGDTILDPDDECKDVAGVPEYRGCPIPDSDADGILDPDDACKDEPETKNGFDDGDGCPDEIPEEVVKFTGVIEGIYFDSDKATIKKSSFKTLDAAIDVLAKFPSVNVEISGHTDDRGERDHNLELSQNRANSVRDYLVSKGIDTARITTRGAGPDEPIADNKKKAGRAKNRRIEFKIVQQ